MILYVQKNDAQVSKQMNYLEQGKNCRENFRKKSRLGPRSALGKKTVLTDRQLTELGNS
jgi:hypothetical protein